MNRSFRSDRINLADIWKIKRSEPRVPLVIPVLIEGKDRQDHQFLEETFTENVSRSGACVLAVRAMQVGDLVTLSTPRGQFQCQAQVKIIWTDDADKLRKAGLQFLEPPHNWVVN
jgi:hypothetical protein